MDQFKRGRDFAAWLGRVVDRLLDNSNGGESLIFASDRFGLIQQRAANGGGY